VGALVMKATLAADVPALRLLMLPLVPVTMVALAADAFRAARAAALLVVPSLLQPMVLASVGRAYAIPGEPMMPALLPGDRVLVAPRGGGPVERGAVVVHVDGGEPVVSRVVGLPGDTLAMRAGRLLVDGRPVPEPYAVRAARGYAGRAGHFDWQRDHLAAGVDRAAYRPTSNDCGPLVVPAGRYLTLGDNRADSFDGRFTGFVAEGEITHRMGWIYFSRPPSGPVRWSRVGRSVR